jgi:translation initiation factor eIF-2B subunit gamma
MFAEASSSATSAPKEFQAVILAGNGDDLSPLTSAGLPKALLPIGNRPIIEGVLRWLEEAQLLGMQLLKDAWLRSSVQ